MCFFPFPALVFPKNREIPGNSREVIFGNSLTGTTLVIALLIVIFVAVAIFILEYRRRRHQQIPGNNIYPSQPVPQQNYIHKN